MIEVSAGEVSTLVAGEVYCLMIEACQPIFDYGRLVQWTEQLSNWCSAQPELVMFTGQCAVHRGQIMRIRGAYADAVVEFDRAVLRYLEVRTPVAAGFAHSERADVLRLRGDLRRGRGRVRRGHLARLRTAARAGPALAGAGPDHGRRRRGEPAAGRARAGDLSRATPAGRGGDPAGRRTGRSGGGRGRRNWTGVRG